MIPILSYCKVCGQRLTVEVDNWLLLQEIHKLGQMKSLWDCDYCLDMASLSWYERLWRGMMIGIGRYIPHPPRAIIKCHENIDKQYAGRFPPEGYAIATQSE